MGKNVQVLILITLATFGVNGWSAGKIYKCKDVEGAMIYQKTPCTEDVETVTSWTPEETKKPAIAEEASNASDKTENKEPSPVLKLKQNAGGHYATDGSINDKSLSFVVDTGASYVSLPESIAHDALIYCDDKIGLNTANGKADACTAKIKKLQFGPFSISDVEAVIVPNLGQPLLGMNVLQLFKLAQENGEMHVSILDQEKKP